MWLCPLSQTQPLPFRDGTLSARVFIHWGCQHQNTAGGGSHDAFRRREGPGPGISRVAPPEALSLALSPPHLRTPVRQGQGHLTACFLPLHRPCLQNPEGQGFSIRILRVPVQPQQEAEQDHSGVGKGESSAEAAITEWRRKEQGARPGFTRLVSVHEGSSSALATQ